jgi:lipoate-protein ligase A
MEEYLLKNRNDDIFMLWQNEPTVVVGKHQNSLSEINLNFVDQNNIYVARRLSGGGTVYHDLGNLNFTFIINGLEGKMVDFGKYTSDMVGILNDMGIPAISNKRHDLTIDGKKISGNAEHIVKNRVLHHGTLLFNSNLDMLEKAITPSSGKYIDKSVQSIRSKVCNIFQYLNKPMTIEQFGAIVMEGMIKKYTGSALQQLNSEEIDEVRELSINKYSNWDWIFGYSPKYTIENQLNTQEGNLDINLVVNKGIISESKIGGTLRDELITSELNNILVGIKHDKETILNIIKKSKIFRDNMVHEIVSKLF